MTRVGYMVVTEIHDAGSVERWFYGCWDDEDRANEVALELGAHDGIYHIVIDASNAEAMGVQNIY